MGINDTFLWKILVILLLFWTFSYTPVLNHDFNLIAMQNVQVSVHIFNFFVFCYMYIYIRGPFSI